MINEEEGILMNERTLNISDRIILIIDKFLKAQEEQILKKVQQILITKFNQYQNINEKLLVCDILSAIVREAKSDYRETLEQIEKTETGVIDLINHTKQNDETEVKHG